MGRVYLAGPIAGHTHDECTQWRDDVIRHMDKRIDCYCPMRGKAFLREHGVMDVGGYDHPLAKPAAILGRDYNDVKNADVVLVNLLGAVDVSIGTVMEVAWAYAMQIPVILVMREKNVHDHVMLNGAATYIVEDLETAVAVAELICLPDTRRNADGFVAQSMAEKDEIITFLKEERDHLHERLNARDKYLQTLRLDLKRKQLEGE